MGNTPLLSIIIPCYNNGNYLTEMLDCFLRQTVEDWEIIIVDDGSTDNTPQLIDEYLKKDSRINFFVRDRQPKGSVVCRNIGFEHSKGKYICHLDADDLVSPTFVENRVNFMERNPDLDYASFCTKVFTDPNHLPTYNSKVRTYGVKVNTHDLLEDFLTANYSFSVWCNIYRRKSIENLSWDENVKIYTDFSFILPGILSGLKHSFSDIKDVDYYYRLFTNKTNSSNMCSNFVSDEKCDSTLYLFDRTLKSLKTRSDYQKRKKQFFKYIILNFERLMLRGDNFQINRYLDFVTQRYSLKESLKLVRIFEKCKTSQKGILFELKLYWYLVTDLGATRYKYALLGKIKKILLSPKILVTKHL